MHFTHHLPGRELDSTSSALYPTPSRQGTPLSEVTGSVLYQIPAVSELLPDLQQEGHHLGPVWSKRFAGGKNFWNCDDFPVQKRKAQNSGVKTPCYY